MMGSWKSRGHQYIEFARGLYCKLPTNGKQLPAFPLEAVPGKLIQDKKPKNLYQKHVKRNHKHSIKKNKLITLN